MPEEVEAEAEVEVVTVRERNTEREREKERRTSWLVRAQHHRAAPVARHAAQRRAAELFVQVGVREAVLPADIPMKRKIIIMMIRTSRKRKRKEKKKKKKNSASLLV